MYTKVGERIKFIREYLLNKPRSYFKENYNIANSTLRNWEYANRLSDKNIDYIISIFKDNNIEVTREWLISGLGKSPIDVSINDIKEIFKHESRSLNINSFNGTSSIFTAKNTKMSPIINPQDKISCILIKDIKPYEQVYALIDYENKVEICIAKKVITISLFSGHIVW